MAPPPPELMFELVGEILLRLPPSDPASLIRASLVCKPWLRLVFDAAFLRRYIAFHGAPPLLGFLANIRGNGYNEPRLVPSATHSCFKPPAFDCSRLPWVMDCRHGRALLFDMWADSEGALSVWDPVTGDRQVLPKPRRCKFISAAAVLCAGAAAGCDHLDCRGDPFLVVCLGMSPMDDGFTLTDVCVYSSQAGSWGAPASIDLGPDSISKMNRGVITGDEVYFGLMCSARILKCGLRNNALSLIDLPDQCDHWNFVLMLTEDSSLGLANVRDSNLYLSSWKVNPEGLGEWVNYRVIKLETLLSIRSPCAASVIGFAEGVDVIFVSTYVGVFAAELKSGKVTKVGGTEGYLSVLPIMGFYTPDFGRRRHRHGLADF
ncbi:unnamed protein product [Urochloa decumbens]|uniref:F-box domain-containing protein n=1 Tax=Urochloa decumbens TaxID=240449 RepID=A0ABC8VK02_9POAL